MEEILLSILEELRTLNVKVSEIELKMDEMMGIGPYNTISDIYDKLDEVQNEVNSIKGLGGYDLADIKSTLDNIDFNTNN